MVKGLIVAISLTVIGLLCCSTSFAYEVPDVSKATLVFEEKQLIADRQPPSEILIRTYRNADGTLFREYGVQGRVFRYDMDEDGSAPYEYRLIDDDGDGVFETREKLVGEMVIKDKGQKYFIDLGPEPGKEYRYVYEKEAQKPVNMRQEAQILEGVSLYIPTWVLAEF